MIRSPLPLAEVRLCQRQQEQKNHEKSPRRKSHFTLHYRLLASHLPRTIFNRFSSVLPSIGSLRTGHRAGWFHQLNSIFPINRSVLSRIKPGRHLLRGFGVSKDPVFRVSVRSQVCFRLDLSIVFDVSFQVAGVRQVTRRICWQSFATEQPPYKRYNLEITCTFSSTGRIQFGSVKIVIFWLINHRVTDIVSRLAMAWRWWAFYRPFRYDKFSQRTLPPLQHKLNNVWCIFSPI